MHEFEIEYHEIKYEMWYKYVTEDSFYKKYLIFN